MVKKSVGGSSFINDMIEDIMKPGVGTSVPADPVPFNGGKGKGKGRKAAVNKQAGGVDISPFITSLVLLGIRVANDDKFKNLINGKKLMGNFNMNSLKGSKRGGGLNFADLAEVQENQVVDEGLLNDLMPLEEKTGGKGKRKAAAKKGKKHGGFEELSVNATDPMQYMISLDDVESVGGKKKRRAPVKKGKKHGGFEELVAEPEMMDMSLVSDETVGGKKKRKPRAKKSMRGGENTITPTFMPEEMPPMDTENLMPEMSPQEEMEYDDEMMLPEEQPMSSTGPMEGGKKKRKPRAKKAGGNFDFKQLIADLDGGCGNCKKSSKKRRGGSDEMPVEMPIETPVESPTTGGKKARKPRKSGKA